MQKALCLPNEKMLYAEAVELLTELIKVPSFSKTEDKTAQLLDHFLYSKGCEVNRHKNNVWVKNEFYDENKPTILLNSHHDTVRPNKSYTRDPFSPDMEDGKLFGLGSTDASGALVSLLSTFLYFTKRKDLKYNLIFAATAEEEISGRDGVESILPQLGKIDLAIVGEPTNMNIAISERGLMVLDCTVNGNSGHATREERENAIYKAMKEIEWFNTFKFKKVSDLLGPIKMSVTMIQSGTQHNVIPDECKFTVDVRINELYSNEEIIKTIQKQTNCTVTPRSFRLQPSSISTNHPIVQAGLKYKRKTYGSPTTSDQALMNFPSLKIGPGDSARSHSADEFIYLKEIEEGLNLYIKLLNEII